MAVKSQTSTLKLGSRCDIVDYHFLNYLNAGGLPLINVFQML